MAATPADGGPDEPQESREHDRPTGSSSPAQHPSLPATGAALLAAALLAAALAPSGPAPRRGRTALELQTHERWDRAMYAVPSAAMPPGRFAWHPDRFRDWAEAVIEPPTGSRLALLPDVLSSSECEALVRLALAAPSLPSASPHYKSRLTVSYADRNYNATHVSPEDAAIVAAVEERVSHLAGLPYNPTDTRLQLTHQGADNVAWSAQTSSPAALHHDFNPMPTRIATLIVYLTDVEEGGETVFPWLGTASNLFWDLSHEVRNESGRFCVESAWCISRACRGNLLLLLSYDKALKHSAVFFSGARPRVQRVLHRTTGCRSLRCEAERAVEREQRGWAVGGGSGSRAPL